MATVTDQVKVYFNKNILFDISPMKVHIERLSRVISAPVETGESSFDNKVIDPVRITITCKVDLAHRDRAEETIELINSVLKNRTYAFCTIVTRTFYSDKMILEKAPSIEEVKEIDIGTFDLVFVEAMLIQGASTTASNPDNNDTVKGGYISAGRVE